MDSGNVNEDKVRVRAYHLWEAEGRPEGREGEFWVRALQLEQQESAFGKTSEPPKAKRAATAKSSPAKPAKTSNALRLSKIEEAPKRRSRAVAAKHVAGSAAMHMQPASAERS
jgi:hypothetical protein